MGPGLHSVVLAEYTLGRRREESVMAASWRFGVSRYRISVRTVRGADDQMPASAQFSVVVRSA